MKKQFFSASITVLFSFFACANMYAQGNGLLLGRTGVELNERPHINNGGDFQAQTRIGGKLDNIVFGGQLYLCECKQLLLG